MRIIHCCLASIYVDDGSYQENLLPLYHRRLGHDVKIIASTDTYTGRTSKGQARAGKSLTKEGIELTRLSYSPFIPSPISHKLRSYSGLTAELTGFKPDLIFLHDCQFLDVYTIKRYIKQHTKVKLLIDCHTDFVNSAKSWLSRNILHGLIYRHFAKTLEPLTERFYGVLPARCDFLHDAYGISRGKIDLLPLGADDANVCLEEKAKIKSLQRAKLGLREKDIVLVTGGKIDARKEIHTLIKAIDRLNNNVVKLVVFGEPTLDIKKEFQELAKLPFVNWVGWVKPLEAYDLFLASDLAVFPGTHSVLWEQAVFCGLPAIFGEWPGFSHVDLGGNCVFVEPGNLSALVQAIQSLTAKPEKLRQMSCIAETLGPTVFSYTAIARKSLSCVT
jgi:1,2-diacylglycerol 3-alpha-glucosyltransferase